MGADAPQLFVDGANRMDVIQGILGIEIPIN